MKEGGVILVVDDEQQIRRFLKISLELCGYNVIEAESGYQGMSKAISINPDLIILDLGLPDMDGLNFLQSLREWSSIPVIVLSVRDSEINKVALLDNGADDYLTKPFNIKELIARIKVAFRHNFTKEETPIFTSGRLIIDFSRRIVTVDNNIIKFTPKEYALLTLLATNSGKVLTQNYILKELWGPFQENESQYLRIYILQLRKKIEEDPSNPEIIITEPGVGYRLVDING
ncbi:MAG: response regulator [Bacteroidetes bacterium]|nr:response regulator [Bacteroidota bacterium]